MTGARPPAAPTFAVRLPDLGTPGEVTVLELLVKALKEDPQFTDIAGYVEDSGEGKWMVKEAVDLRVAIPVISEALMRRFRSRQAEPFAEKVLAALREEFGGHSVKRNPSK